MEPIEKASCFLVVPLSTKEILGHIDDLNKEFCSTNTCQDIQAHSEHELRIVSFNDPVLAQAFYEWVTNQGITVHTLLDQFTPRKIACTLVVKAPSNEKNHLSR